MYKNTYNYYNISTYVSRCIIEKHVNFTYLSLKITQKYHVYKYINLQVFKKFKKI